MALLNSKLFTYYILEQSPKNSNKSYPSFTSSILKNLPIKLATKKTQDLLEKLVDKIIELKKLDAKADTSKYENEINKLVYQLYDLTPSEIEIIEKE